MIEFPPRKVNCSFNQKDISQMNILTAKYGVKKAGNLAQKK